MRKILVGLSMAAAIAVSPAGAQQLPQYALSLTNADVSYLGRLLRQRPYDEVYELMGRLNSQVTAQDQAAIDGFVQSKIKAQQPVASAPKADSAPVADKPDSPSSN